MRSALCDLAFLADNLRRDVHAGYGFGTNYDIPVVILRKQDYSMLVRASTGNLFLIIGCSGMRMLLSRSNG